MGPVIYTTQMVSMTNYFLKAVSLKWLLLGEQWTECTSKDRGGGEGPLSAWISLQVNWW